MKTKKIELRREKSVGCSGKLNPIWMKLIPELERKNYIVKDFLLDGDAPKQFIRAYTYQRDTIIRKCSRSSWPGYIAKTAEKWYPHESIIEYMMNRIGQVLGLNMNEIRLVRANGQIRFLSRYFINTKKQKLIHGAEICGEHLGDMLFAKEIADDRVSARQLFTFEFIREAIRTVFPSCFEALTQDLVRLLTFDALAGNNDRHFYNWGVIDTKKKTTQMPSFAPVYDSARGLLWNYSDENIKNLHKLHKEGTNRLVKYVRNASPRISIEKNKTANHFELIEFVRLYNKDYRNIVNGLASEENEQRVLQMLELEFFPFFIPERNELISTIIKERFKIVRGKHYDTKSI